MSNNYLWEPEPRPIRLHAHDAGMAFGNGTSTTQALFLHGLLCSTCEGNWSWPVQCQAIAEVLREQGTAEDLAAIHAILTSLTDAIKDA